MDLFGLIWNQDKFSLNIRTTLEGLEMGVLVTWIS